MKKIILALFAVLSINAFPELEFKCWEDGSDQNCTSRKPVNLSGFDSNITDAINSNWYNTNTINDSNSTKYAFIFYDDEILNDTKEKFSAFAAIDNGVHDDGRSMSEGAAFYQHVNIDSKCNTSGCKIEGEIDYTIYAFVGDTKVNLVKSNGEFTVSKQGTNDLSSIRFGSNTQPCSFQQTGVQHEDYRELSINFRACPVTVTAVDPNTNTAYQYTSDFSSLAKTFVSDNHNIGNEGEVERELLNADGNQIGYLIFNFFNSTFRVVDLNREAFSSDS